MDLRKFADALAGSTTREGVRGKYQDSCKDLAQDFFADDSLAASTMRRARDNVHRYSSTVLCNGGDASVQELLLTLANEHGAMAQAINNVERPEAKIMESEQAMETNKQVLKDLVKELRHHDVALKRLTARLTLLEGLALGVSQAQLLKFLVFADSMLPSIIPSGRRFWLPMQLTAFNIAWPPLSWPSTRMPSPAIK